MISLKVYNYVCRQERGSEQGAAVCKRKITTLPPFRQNFNIQSSERAAAQATSEYSENSEHSEHSENSDNQG